MFKGLKFRIKEVHDMICSLHIAKTMAQNSCRAAFVFEYAKSRVSHDAAQIKIAGKNQCAAFAQRTLRSVGIIAVNMKKAYV